MQWHRKNVSLGRGGGSIVCSLDERRGSAHVRCGEGTHNI